MTNELNFLKPGDKLKCINGGYGSKTYAPREGSIYTFRAYREGSEDIYLEELGDVSWMKKRFKKILVMTHENPYSIIFG